MAHGGSMASRAARRRITCSGSEAAPRPRAEERSSGSRRARSRGSTSTTWRRGAVVDNLGVVNATAKQLTRHNLADHWRNQLAHRGSDLVVVMLGTNEAEW